MLACLGPLEDENVLLAVLGPQAAHVNRAHARVPRDGDHGGESVITFLPSTATKSAELIELPKDLSRLRCMVLKSERRVFLVAIFEGAHDVPKRAPNLNRAMGFTSRFLRRDH